MFLNEEPKKEEKEKILTEEELLANAEKAKLAAYSEMFPHGKNSNDVILPKKWSLDLNNDFSVVGTIIVNQYGQILVGFNKKRQCWDIPQGTLEEEDYKSAKDFDEVKKKAMVRELKEELNLDISVEDISLISETKHLTESFVKSWSNNLYIIKNNYLDLTKIINNEPEKCSDLKWFSPVQLPSPRGLSLRIALTLMGC